MFVIFLTTLLTLAFMQVYGDIMDSYKASLDSLVNDNLGVQTLEVSMFILGTIHSTIRNFIFSLIDLFNQTSPPPFCPVSFRISVKFIKKLHGFDSLTQASAEWLVNFHSIRA